MTREPFERVVQRHGAMVLRLCRAVVGPSDADDAWSDTFLSALGAYPDLPADANVAAWLTTIARRRSIDLLRRRARQPQPTPTEPLDRPAPSAAARRGPAGAPGADGPEQLVVDRAIDPQLQAALAALTDRQRTAVVHHHIVGLAHRDLAALLDTTPAAARRSTADGISRLRQLLAAPAVPVAVPVAVPAAPPPTPTLPPTPKSNSSEPDTPTVGSPAATPPVPWGASCTPSRSGDPDPPAASSAAPPSTEPAVRASSGLTTDPSIELSTPRPEGP